jgi:predicted MFS family arabinose efflux permease
VFAFAVFLIGLVQLGFVVLLGGQELSQVLATSLILLLIAVFFTGFNILEALQPSLISRIAPATGKARALGIYNTLQSLGLFVGGALGGWLLQTGGFAAVFGGCGLLALIWLIILVKWPARLPA